MHDEAFQWMSQFRTEDPIVMLDIGGRNVNGTPRLLFPNAVVYIVLDIEPGSNVDIVADAATWTPDREYDLVVSTECFEHAADWPQICVTAFKACKPGGRFIATMAGPGRPQHSGIDGGSTLYAGEHYANVDGERLRDVLEAVGFRDVIIDKRVSPADVRCCATR